MTFGTTEYDNYYDGCIAKGEFVLELVLEIYEAKLQDMNTRERLEFSTKVAQIIKDIEEDIADNKGYKAKKEAEKAAKAQSATAQTQPAAQATAPTATAAQAMN